MPPATSLRHRLWSGGGWALLGRGLQAVTELLIGALLARLLAPADLGAYFLLLSIVLFGGLAGSLGLAQAAVRLVAQVAGNDQSAGLRPLARMLVELGLFGAVATAALYWLAGDVLVARFFRLPTSEVVTGLVALWIAATALQRLAAEIFRGLHDIRRAALHGGVYGLLWLIAGLLALAWFADRASLEVVTGIAAAAAGLGVLGAGIVLWRRLPQAMPVAGTRRGYRAILRLAWPLLMIQLTLFVLTQLDTWILALFRPPQEVALYAAASRLALAMLLANSVLYAVLPPLIAERHARGELSLLERLLRAGATATSVLALPLFALFVFAPQTVLALFYGDYYREGAAVLAALASGLFINVLSGMRGYVLMMTGHERLELAIALVGGLCNVVFCVLGVVLWGMVGVALGAMSAMILQCLLEEVAVRRRLGIWTHFSLRSFGDIRGMFPRRGAVRG
jgi:O-antigen/teichoic acid export membrane protein